MLKKELEITAQELPVQSETSSDTVSIRLSYSQHSVSFEILKKAN